MQKSQNKRELLQNFQLNHIQNSCSIFLRCSRTKMTNLSKTRCFNENLFTYNGKTLYVESSARGYYIKENTLLQRNNSCCRIIFPEADRGTLQNWWRKTLQKDGALCNKTWQLVNVSYMATVLILIPIKLLLGSGQIYPED